jgi:hypothetical protein
MTSWQLVWLQVLPLPIHLVCMETCRWERFLVQRNDMITASCTSLIAYIFPSPDRRSCVRALKKWLLALVYVSAAQGVR